MSKQDRLRYLQTRQNANNLKRRPRIKARCAEVLYEHFTNKNVDSELNWVVGQRKDLSSKVRAIAEVNKLRARISDAPTQIQAPATIVILPVREVKSLPQGTRPIIVQDGRIINSNIEA